MTAIGMIDIHGLTISTTASTNSPFTTPDQRVAAPPRKLAMARPRLAELATPPLSAANTLPRP